MPKQPTNDLTWLDLADFRAGIMSKVQRTGSTAHGPYPVGAAQQTDTFRCIALPGGGLGPLPKAKHSFALPEQDAGATDDGKYHLVGFYSFGPVLSGTPTAGTDEFHIGVEWIKSSVRKFRWLRMRQFDGSNTLDTVKSIDSAEPTPVAIFWGMSFCTTRMNPTDTGTAGWPVVVASWAAGGGGFEKFVTAFPDPTDATTAAANSPKDLSTSRYGTVVGHQGRVVLLEANAYEHGNPPGATGAVPTNELVSFTDANSDVIGTQKQVFMAEFPNGYGAYGSISAGELFLVKQQGGAVDAQGDISYPQLIRLPGVVSTGNVSGRGCSSPVGFVYGTSENGVWLWRGADTSEKISQQLEDDFHINTEAGAHNNERIFFAEWADWVLVSNNWLWDTQSGSWWRIEDPDSYRFLHWSRGFNSNWMYGAVAQVDSGASRVFAWAFKRNEAASSWSWKSHPMLLDDNDLEADVRQVVLMAQGAGTVTVTLANESGDVDTLTFTLTDATKPVRLRQDAHTHGQWVTVKIEAAHTSTGAAPIVYKVKLGWQSRQHLAGG